MSKATLLESSGGKSLELWARKKPRLDYMLVSAAMPMPWYLATLDKKFNNKEISYQCVGSNH